MSQTPDLAKHYARCLARRVVGHPLYEARIIDSYPAFRIDGSNLFDVAWINAEGRLRYGFSAARGPNHMRNRDFHRSLLPPDHERYTGGDLPTDTNEEVIPGSHCYKSHTSEEVTFSVEASVPAGPPGTASVGGEISFSMADNAGALLYLPQDHVIFRAFRPNLCSNYARKHTAAWYQFLNGDNQNHGIRNGDLYFVTGCYKSKEWHNACSFSSRSSRAVALKFQPIPEHNLGFTGRLSSSSSAVESHRGPGAPQARRTQCLVVVGWKLALCSRFLRIAKEPVTVDASADSNLFSKLFGKSSWAPFSSPQTGVSNPPPPSNNSSSSGSQARDSNISPDARSEGSLPPLGDGNPISENVSLVSEASGKVNAVDDVTESVDSMLTVRDDNYTKLKDTYSKDAGAASRASMSLNAEHALPNGCHGELKVGPSSGIGPSTPHVHFQNEQIVAYSQDAFWVDTGKQLGIDGYGPATHALTEVFPYIEESAPWMETVIAHDMDYLAVVAENEIVPEAKELAARLMLKFVIDVDEDMNGMLVNREEAHLTRDDLAFVVHDARRYTDSTFGFDVVRKNIPVGWTLAGPRFGLGVQTLVAAVHVQSTTVKEGLDTKVPGSTAKTFEMSFGLNDSEDDEDDNDFPSDPPPPYEPSNRHSPYALVKAGLASLEYLDALNSDKGIVLPPADLASEWGDYPKWQDEIPFDLSKKFMNRLAKVVYSEQKRQVGWRLARANEVCEASMLKWAKAGLDLIDKTGHPQAMRYVAHRKRVLEWYGYNLWNESHARNPMRSPLRV